MSNIIAVILAGGEGKRFWPLSQKVLFPCMGKSFFEHAILSKLPKGISKIVVVASPENHDALARVSYPVPHTIVVQAKPQGMTDALLTAENHIQNAQLLVINGDDISDSNVFEGVLKQASESNAFGVISGVETKFYQDLGYLSFQNNKITKIVEKPGKGREPSNVVFMISYFIRDSNVFIEALKKENDHEMAISSLMKDQQFDLYKHNGQFVTLKFPWHVLDVIDLLLRNLKSYRGSNVVIKDNVVIEGEVWIGANTKIFENTKIIGPCYIGSDTIIGNNNIIRGSVIGDTCVTGFNSDITRSYIGDGCWFHSNYIGDSVLESSISMGSGAVLANLRLDEGEIISSGRTKLGAMIGHNVRIGVNASVMPGIKIGKNSLVGSGVILDRDLEDASFCTIESTLRISKNKRSI